MGLYIYMPEIETVPYLCVCASLGVWFLTLIFALFCACGGGRLRVGVGVGWMGGCL